MYVLSRSSTEIVSSLLFTTLVVWGSLSFAQSKHEHALASFDQGKALYKAHQFSQAIDQFRTCFRLIQENKCLYYLAASTSKLDPPASCFDPYLAWQRYLDHCNLKIQHQGSQCQSSWIKQAQKQGDLYKKRCSQGKRLGSERLDQSSNQPTQSPKATQNQSGLKMSTSFHCQYKSGSAYVDLKSCNGETLREGDRVRLSIKPFEKGYLYILLFNESGQSQMVFPGSDESNLIQAHTRFFIPNDPYYGGWFEVDEVAGVTEILSIIFSKQPIRDLEKAKGANLPPSATKNYHQGHLKGSRELIEVRKGINEHSQVIAEEIVGDVDHVVTHFRFRHQ